MATLRSSKSAAFIRRRIRHRSSISCAAKIPFRWSKRRSKSRSSPAPDADIPIFYVTTLYCNRDRRPHRPAGIEDLARGMGALMRIAVAAAAVCLSLIGLSLADNASASIREPTHIPAQGLGPALKQLAQSRGLQGLYLSNTVRDIRTNGADGDITANEALEQLLSGTGLTYRYLDEKTVTVVPLKTSSLNDGAGVSLQGQTGGAIANSPAEEPKSISADRYLLAQTVPAPAQQPI